MPGVSGGQVVVGIGWNGLVRDANGGLLGEKNGGGRGDGWGGDRYGINRCEDTVANVILLTDNNAPLSYAP